MSRPVDIVSEYKAALAAVTPRYRGRIAELGLIAPANRIGLVGVARVTARSGNIFEPEAGGDVAVILPAWDGPIADARVIIDAPERLIDLVAWRPGKRDKRQLAGSAALCTRLGIATLLGGEAVEIAAMSRQPLRVFRDPGGWARAGGGAAGAVIVDWTADNGLFQVEQIVCEDQEHAEDVEHLLKLLRVRLTPRLPEIRIPVAPGMVA